MLQCPSCDATLSQDFGMVTCSSCRAVLMIDLSGKVQVGTKTAPVEEDQLVEPTSETVFENSGIYEEAETATEDLGTAAIVPELPGSDEKDELLDEDDFVASDEQNFAPIQNDLDNAIVDSTEDTSFEEEDEDEESEDDEFENSEEEAVNEAADTHFENDEEEDETVFPMPQQPDSKPVDITSFANSEISSLEEGEFLYDVKLARIDSKDLKEALKYVLLDEKLKLNHHEFLKKIKNGKVTIPDLNPIKAKRIVEQLQYFDMDIKWVQKRVIMEVLQPDQEETDEELDEDANV